MSSYYGVIFSRFWTGDTGRKLRVKGGKDAQLLGVYLFSNPYMNMLGLYSLKPRDIRDDVDLSPAQLAKTFAVMRDLEYAFYDYATGFVWVKEMATFRLSIKDNEPLDRKDKRAIGAQKLYAGLTRNPWLSPFFDRYGKLLHLKTRREGPPPVVAPEGPSSPSNGLRRGFDASKQNQNQIQSTDPEAGTSSAAAAAPPRPSGESPEENYPVIEKLAFTSIDVLGVSDLGDLVEDLKHRCAEYGIPYNSAVTTSAVKSAVYQRTHPR